MIFRKERKKIIKDLQRAGVDSELVSQVQKLSQYCGKLHLDLKNKDRLINHLKKEVDNA